MSFKVKCDCAIGLTIYGVLLLDNSSVCPNSAALRNIRLRNLNNLDCNLSRSLTVKRDGAIGLPCMIPIDV